MRSFLANLEIQFASFIIGFAAGVMVFWLFQRFQPALSRLWQRIRDRFSSVRVGLSLPIDKRYRMDAYRVFSEEHLASPLFTMQEVAISPKLIAPPPPVIPGEALPPEAITDIAVPYLPDMPTVGGQFHVKTLTIPEAMSKGGNLLLFGPPGSGRTFALCYLACQIALKDPAAGDLVELSPLYVHAGSLDLTKASRPLDVLYQALANKVSIMAEAGLRDYFRKNLSNARMLILVDGFDELPPEDRPLLLSLLKNLQEEYPGNRYIVSSSAEDLSAQLPLQLFPFGLAGWTDHEKLSFLRTWGRLWEEHIPTQGWASGLPRVFDPVVLNAWLYHDSRYSSPFDITLKAWAAYAGDSRGRSETAAIDAYIYRMSAGIMNARPALENLAAQSILSAKPFLKRRTAAGYIVRFEEVVDESLIDDNDPFFDQDVEELLEEAASLPTSVSSEDLLDDDLDALLDELDQTAPGSTASEEAEPTEGSGEDAGRPRGRALLPQLTDARLLVEYPDGRFGFIHPIFAGFLAGANLTSQESLQALDAQQEWIGKRVTQQFLPYYQAEMTTLISRAMNAAKQQPLQSSLVEASAWLRHVSGSPAWRTGFMRSLAASLQDENLPMALRSRILANLVFSGAAGVNKLLQQMLKSSKSSVRWLGVLGCGLTRDQSALDDLVQLLYQSPSPLVSQAACLALATFGSDRALELLTQALLDADDHVRRAAAEALALHPLEGHPVLREGAELEDVNVRRAVVFGLARVKERWAEEMLLQLQTGDDQWVVRNAAIQIIEDMKLDAISIPQELPPLHDTPWLVSYASKKGMGLSPGQGAWDMLLDALKAGDEETKLAAMYVYRRKPNEAEPAAKPLLTLMSEDQSEVREAAYLTLWQLHANQVDFL
ncbi:MAG: HEAT repeat domain-containing protein [Anaerolineales bacterium]|nr:HEAT repeat domain-containing protein [Anaerolineales bacterium]